MPTTCAVSTCKNRACRSGEYISFFTFPKDIEVRNKWIKACDREILNPNTSRICSEHFTETDFARDLKAELLGYLPSRKCLKKEAVPSLNLCVESSTGRQRGTLSCSIREMDLLNTEPYIKEEDPLDQKPVISLKIQHLALDSLISSKTEETDKSSDAKKFKCVKCYGMKKKINSYVKKVKQLSMCAKIAESRLIVMQRKITRLEQENKELKGNLKKVLF